MIAVAGVFGNKSAAERARDDLEVLGLEESDVSLIETGESEKKSWLVPTDDSEPMGMAQTLGAFLGGAVGLSAGFLLGSGAAFLLHWTGSAWTFGCIGAAIVGLAGAISAGIFGRRVDRAAQGGLPKDELFLYQDAVRQGRSVVIGMARDELDAGEAKRILERDGADSANSIDAAAPSWYLGFSDVAREHYHAQHAATEGDPFVRGFQAAIDPEFSGKPWDQVVYLLAERYNDWYTDRFREGFDRGQASKVVVLQPRLSA